MICTLEIFQVPICSKLDGVGWTPTWQIISNVMLVRMGSEVVELPLTLAERNITPLHLRASEMCIHTSESHPRPNIYKTGGKDKVCCSLCAHVQLETYHILVSGCHLVYSQSRVWLHTYVGTFYGQNLCYQNYMDAGRSEYKCRVSSLTLIIYQV